MKLSEYEAQFALFVESEDWPSSMPRPTKVGGGQTGYGGFYPVPGRRFQPDFVWPDHKVCLEIIGGSWRPGGHEPLGRAMDIYEKYNLMQLEGWFIVFAVPPFHLSERVLGVLEKALRMRERAPAKPRFS